MSTDSGFERQGVGVGQNEVDALARNEVDPSVAERRRQQPRKVPLTSWDTDFHDFGFLAGKLHRRKHRRNAGSCVRLWDALSRLFAKQEPTPNARNGRRFGRRWRRSNRRSPDAALAN